jgi:hemolysin activation/secretion protein
VRYQLLQDQFLRTRNKEQIARTEFLALGLDLRLEVTRALESWGSTQSSWLYSAVLSDGYSFSWGHEMLGSLTAERRVASTGQPLDHQGALLRYFGPESRNAAFYGLASFDRIGTAAAPDQLSLGGDSGLRGYPLRYQEGERRALFTLEQRYYTDWYPFRLLRVGGAVFYDHGRAWGGVNQNTVNGGWLRDAGVGLRLSFDRTAFANVLHADIAVPLDRVPGIKSVQYIVKTQLTF